MKKPQETEQEAPKATPKKSVVKRISTVFFILLFTGILACIISVVTTKYIYNRPAALFGYRIVKILTDSMTPELPTNSYILVKNINGSEVKEGDIVVHIPAYGDFAGLSMTHKCIKGPYYDETLGKTCILTQGTKEGAPVDAPVPISNVQSVYLRSVGKAGGFFDFLTSIWGITVMVALPSLVVIVLQVVRMVRAVVAKPDEEKVKEEAARIEKERSETRQAEMLESMIRDANGAVLGTTERNGVGDLGDVMAYIAREKAKNAQQDGEGESPKPTDEMSSVMAFIAREKAKENKKD